jgi:glycosyltransferase involved in cell wall biosynthesis
VAGLDVGLMPLTPTRFSRGKCGFKLLQYMAAGVPAIATPTEANRHILADGRCGILAETPAEWAAALHGLAGDAGWYRALAAAGAARVRREYSLQVWAPRVVDLLTAFVAGARS